MASPEQSQGAGPPDPIDVAALQPKTMLCGEREGALAMTPSPAAHVAAAAGGLRCKAFLVLALCLAATVLPYSLAWLAAPAQAPPGSLPSSPSHPGSPAYQQGTGDSLVATRGDLLSYAVPQQHGRVLVGSAGIPGCFLGVREDVSCGSDAEGQSPGTPIAATASPLTPQHLGSGQGEGLRPGTAVALTLSPAQRLSTGVPATSAWLPQTTGAPSPASQYHLPLGSLASTGPGSHDVMQVPASPDHQTTSRRAALSAAASSKPPAVVTASNLSSQAGAGAAAQAPSSPPASHQPTAGGFSDAQRGDPVAGATLRSRNGQKEEVRPSPGKDHPAAPHPVSLPGMPSALPTERPSSLTEMHPSTTWVPAVTAEMLWDTQPAGTSLPGLAALLVDPVLAKVLGNGSGLLGTVLAPHPQAASAHGGNHPQVLAPFLPTVESGGPAATLGTPSDLPSPPELPVAPKAPPSPAWSSVPSTAGPAVTGVSSEAPGAIPEPGATKAVSKDGAAVLASPLPGAAGVTHGPTLGSPTQGLSLHLGTVAEDGPPGPTRASPGSVPPPSSKNPALEHFSVAVHCTGTTTLPSPSYLLPSTGAVPAASSQALAAPAGAMPDAQSMSGHSITSQHPSAAREHLPTAAGEASTPAVLVTMGQPSSPGLPAPAQPVHVLPLQFRLLGIAYTEELSNKSSGSYRELEEEVMLMLNQMLSTYETFLRANVLEFMNGSVVVRGEALFQGDAPAPTNSHLIRTVISEVNWGRSTFGWQLEPQSVRSGGFSLENLDPEKLSVSFTVLQSGKSRTASLEELISEVTQSLSPLYHVRNFTVAQVRSINGDLEVTGDTYLDTIAHADVSEVLQALTILATSSVDLTSLSVEGAKPRLRVFPFSFLIINRHFSEDLRDPLAAEYQDLVRDLSDAVARALSNELSFRQVVIREFLPGSLICHGDLVFQCPSPTRLEVWEKLVYAVGLNKALAGSDFQVEPHSILVGDHALELLPLPQLEDMPEPSLPQLEKTPEPSLPQSENTPEPPLPWPEDTPKQPPRPWPGFSEYIMAIMVLCGLCIIAAPVALLVYLWTRSLGWWDVAALRDRRDPEAGTQTLEMDNQGFWASSEQAPEDAQTHWHSNPA